MGGGSTRFELLFEPVHDPPRVRHQALIGLHAEHQPAGVAEDAVPRSYAG